MMYHDIRCHVDLVEPLRALTADRDTFTYPKRKTYQRIGFGRDWNVRYVDSLMTAHDQLQARIERLKYVDEVCLTHQAWMIVATETSRFDVAERRLKNVKAKVMRVITKWAESLPRKEAQNYRDIISCS